MLEKIIIIALLVLAGTYLVRRFLRKGSTCGCGCSDSGSGGCCGGQRDIKHIDACGCSRKS